MTLNSFTDCTVRYETTLNECTCPDHSFHPGNVCKHMEALRRAYARAKAQTFDELRRKYDSRLNGQAETQRCYFEMSFE